jgi:hypothetical protein
MSRRDLTDSFLGAPTLIGARRRGTSIKLIQRGTIAIAAAGTTGTATITAVRPEHSVLKYLGYSNSGDAATILEDNCRLTFTNSTTITATHNTAGNDIVASFEVVEYWPGVIRSIQRGTITIVNAAATATATITAVVMLRSSLDDLGYTFTTATTSGIDSRARFVLTNETTLTATRIGLDQGVVLSFQVVENY